LQTRWRKVKMNAYEADNNQEHEGNECAVDKFHRLYRSQKM